MPLAWGVYPVFKRVAPPLCSFVLRSWYQAKKDDEFVYLDTPELSIMISTWLSNSIFFPITSIWTRMSILSKTLGIMKTAELRLRTNALLNVSERADSHHFFFF